MKRRRRVETSEDLVRAFADLFDETELETQEEVDVVLREAGLDPNQVRIRTRAVVDRAIADSPLNWRNQANKLEQERERIAKATRAIFPNRADIIAAIKRLMPQPGGQMAFAYRNPEEQTDEDLVELLTELKYLESKQQQENDE
ncbi:MAG: hypothetical protein JW934_12345 [Anaerolineae bacterium]|nr:hypothetical protein [Anaerolineae bacterium]